MSAPPDDIEQESNGDDAEWVNEDEADAETPMEVEPSGSEESDFDSDLEEEIRVVVHGESSPQPLVPKRVLSKCKIQG